ncbi:prion-inhibition and propagation-domain-containing protein [Phialemonium atrogriseum]|uniref:Prion-inhibition and propagation-domain-containing protein n=1 Tax=Phialemonium atrogriseum TaxID=1093897 RepID=A0AAJ0BQT6_9PEZI|nr:prion-inhibition and propagation-domain-containing protein [Phialemonium atrogriseum]KAK1762770.1 prion-inhibition and propagation-domain-containing protein [Phialemonium atrogriseum]
MAEVAGLVTGLAGLVSNCVDCLEYIRLGRNFGRDYQTCQLRLDVAKTRLGRWGEGIKVNQDFPSVTESSPSGDQRFQLARSILEQIMLLFESTQKTSQRYESVAEQRDLVLFDEDEMKPIFRGLHNRLKSLARRRQKNTSLCKKTACALYDAKSFDRLLDNITALVEELEKLFPVDVDCRRLAQSEIEGVEDEQSLTALRDAADGVDKTLSEAVSQKIATIPGRNYAKDVKTEDRARVQVGHQFNEILGLIGTEQTTNSVETVVAKGESRIQIGSRFGGRGIFDD